MEDTNKPDGSLVMFKILEGWYIDVFSQIIPSHSGLPQPEKDIFIVAFTAERPDHWDKSPCHDLLKGISF